MILEPILDLFRGRAITIPPLDGALKPNTLLEEAELAARVEAPDNLALFQGAVIYSSAGEIKRLSDGATIKTFPAAITALAAMEDGDLAVALESGRIEFLKESRPALDGFKCPVALLAAEEGALIVCNGSERHAPAAWASDLMGKGSSGSLWQVDRQGSRRQIAGALAFPFGVARDADGKGLLVSEAWRHRILRIAAAGAAHQPVIDRLPGYPARLVRAPKGYLLSLFAPRNRLIEFVLREDRYRQAMMEEIEPGHWIAPSLSPARDFLEPLQMGGVRSMGIHKPWSPSRSFGLVMTLDEKLQPLTSFHSRANGQRHGVTSTLAEGADILAAAKGGNAILRLSGALEG